MCKESKKHRFLGKLQAASCSMFTFPRYESNNQYNVRLVSISCIRLHRIQYNVSTSGEKLLQSKEADMSPATFRGTLFFFFYSRTYILCNKNLQFSIINNSNCLPLPGTFSEFRILYVARIYFFRSDLKCQNHLKYYCFIKFQLNN